jgi:hypothetical protein
VILEFANPREFMKIHFARKHITIHCKICGHMLLVERCDNDFFNPAMLVQKCGIEIEKTDTGTGLLRCSVCTKVW